FYYTAPPLPSIYTLSLHDALPIFNPNTGLLYFPMKEETAIYQINKEMPAYKPGERYQGVENTTAPRTPGAAWGYYAALNPLTARSEEHTSELQSRFDLVCRLLLEK